MNDRNALPDNQSMCLSFDVSDTNNSPALAGPCWGIEKVKSLYAQFSNCIAIDMNDVM